MILLFFNSSIYKSHLHSNKNACQFSLLKPIFNLQVGVSTFGYAKAQQDAPNPMSMISNMMQVNLQLPS